MPRRSGPTGLVDGDFVGYAFFFHGSSTGVGMTSPGSSTSHNGTIGASFQFAYNRAQVARGAGDVNGDGYADIVTGAPGRDGGAGGVLLNVGASTGVPTSSAWLLSGAGLVGFGTT